MELPVFVVHGAVVWKVLLVALVAAGLGLVALLRRRGEQKRVAARVAARLSEVTKLEPGAVLLRGRIKAGTASSCYRDLGEPVSQRSDELLLEHAGDVVVVTGPVTVTEGSRTAIEWLRRVVVRSVQPGDEVLLAGVAERCSETDTGYREAGIGWRVAGDLTLTAVTPQTRPRPAGPAWTLVLVAVFGLTGYGALRLIGSQALDRAERSEDEVRRSLGNTDAVAIAAAMPGSRTRALETLGWQLTYRYERTEDVFQARVELDRLTGECAAHMLFEAVRLEEAVVAARACARPVLASQALAFLGRFEEAWNEPGRDDRTWVKGLVAIATGRWKEAAEAAEARAEEHAKRERTKWFTTEDATRMRIGALCLGALFRIWAGEAGAFERIEGRAANDHCRALAAIALPDDQQAAALAALEISRREELTLSGVVSALRLTMDPAAKIDSYSWGMADAIGFGFPAVGWFVPAQLAARSPSATPAERAQLTQQMAALAAYRGDLAGARLLQAAAVQLDPAHRYAFTHRLALDLLDPAATIAPADDQYVHPGIAEAVAFRRGQLPERESAMYAGRCKAQAKAAVVAAQRGDGAPIAAVMRDCRVSWSIFQRVLLGVLPLVKTGRAELAAQVRLFHDDITTYSLSNIPFRFLDNLVWHRRLAALAGDTESAQRWQQIFDRHAAVLADRQKLIALLFWTD